MSARMRVRYQAATGWTDWLECVTAGVQGHVLKISLDEANLIIVPLHTVAGHIELQRVPDDTPPQCEAISVLPMKGREVRCEQMADHVDDEHPFHRKHRVIDPEVGAWSWTDPERGPR